MHMYMYMHMCMLHVYVLVYVYVYVQICECMMLKSFGELLSDWVLPVFEELIEFLSGCSVRYCMHELRGLGIVMVVNIGMQEVYLRIRVWFQGFIRGLGFGLRGLGLRLWVFRGLVKRDVGSRSLAVGIRREGALHGFAVWSLG